MRLIILFIEEIEHIEEIFNVGKIFMGHIILSADSVPIGIGCDSGYKSQQSVDLFISDIDILIDGLS